MHTTSDILAVLERTTHIVDGPINATLLQYLPPFRPVPRVLAIATGAERDALQTEARGRAIHLIDDRELAQTLALTATVGQDIPPATFVAVAGHVAHFQRLEQKRADRIASYAYRAHRAIPIGPAHARRRVPNTAITIRPRGTTR